MTPSGGRDWDKELAKIDRQIASMGDEQPVERNAPPAAGGPAAAPARGGQAAGPASPSRAGVVLRVSLAVALAIGMTIWPYGARCGAGLGAYLFAIAVVAGAGTWAALTTWSARAGRAHVIALLVVGWGLALAAVEVLPRTGYAADPARVSWMCQ